MKVSDIFICGNVWAECKVTIDQEIETLFEGKFYEIPERLAKQEVEFWNISKFKKGKCALLATEIFVSLK